MANKLSARARELVALANKRTDGIMTVRHDLAPLQIGFGDQVLVTVPEVGAEYRERERVLEEVVRAGMFEIRGREGEEYVLTAAGRAAFVRNA